MINFSIYYLRFFNILISGLCFLSILYSYYFDLYLNVDAYFYTLLISILPLISFFFLKKKEIKISIYGKIISVILGYLFLPIFLALPYYLSIYNTFRWKLSIMAIIISVVRRIILFILYNFINWYFRW